MITWKSEELIARKKTEKAWVTYTKEIAVISENKKNAKVLAEPWEWIKKDQRTVSGVILCFHKKYESTIELYMNIEEIITECIIRLKIGWSEQQYNNIKLNGLKSIQTVNP